MKLLLVLLLLTSCATKRKVIQDTEVLEKTCKDTDYMEKMETCMMKFSKQGYDSIGIVKICGKIYERRN